MPTAYDDFTTKADRDRTTASPQARQHSQLLASVMTKYGFIPLATEWWHFDGADWQDFPISDLSLQAIPIDIQASALARSLKLSDLDRMTIDVRSHTTHE